MRSMRISPVSVLLGCLGSLYVHLGFAQQPADSITALKEIVVHKEIPIDLIPPQTLTATSLERLSQASVADALRYFAGVKVKDYGGMGGMKTVDVRNMGTHHVGVYYNGIQVGNAQNGIVDLGKFTLENVEQIDLYNGQRTTVLQSAREFASASAVYIQTKRPVFEENENAHAYVKYTLGSIQWVNPSAGLELKINDKVSTSIHASYLHSNGVYKFRQKRLNLDGSIAYDLSSYRKNSGIESYRIENNWFGKDHRNTWQALVYYYQSQRELPSAIIKKSDITLQTERANEQQGDKNLLMQAEWTSSVSPAYQFIVKGKFAYDQLHYTSRKTVDFEGEEVTYNPQFDNTYHQQEWYLSAAHAVALTPSWKVALATDAQYNIVRATRLGQGSPFSDPERYSFYSALSTTYTHGAFKAQAAVLGSFIKENAQYHAPATDRSFITPSVFVNYQPWHDREFTLHAFYKHTYRLPSFTDLYYTQVGTANVKPEYVRQVNVGFSHQQPLSLGSWKAVSVSLDAYYARVTDKIIASPTSSMMRWMMSNLGKVENYGLEGQIQSLWEPLAGVKAQVGLTYEYTVARDLSVLPAGKPSYYGDQIPYAPWHSASSIVGVDYRNWSLNYSFIYVGKRYNGNKNNNKRNELQPWYTHDVALQKQLKWKDCQLTFRLEANNLANQHYEVVTNFPMPGRNFRLSMRLAI
ncbi:TonB-dependent receptor plug domain-containing protein [Myroides sp. DF42-4-2]|nr:TonB-dependent receptor plug domain-containing protein [Myroides sp. DF42-4-2]